MRYLILEKDEGEWFAIYQNNDLIVVLNEARQRSYTYPDAEIKVIDTSVPGLGFV